MKSHNSEPPLVPGLPVLGNGLEMAGDIVGFFVKNYHKFGPIYQVKALQQRFIIMAGLEANQFLWKLGDEYFSNAKTMGSLSDEFGMKVHGLDGKSHTHLRKVLGSALAPEAITAQWDHFIKFTQERVEQIPLGATVSVVDCFQRLAAEQLSVMLGHQSSADHFDQLRYVFELALDVRLAKKWPAFFLKQPLYQRRKAEIFSLMRRIMTEHRTTTASRSTPDLVDVARDACDEHGQPYPEDAQIGMILQGYFGAINTVAYQCSFMLYALFQQPDIMQRVIDEVHTACVDGFPSVQACRKQMATLHAVAQEALRMYDPAPASVRTVSKPFEFGGYQVDPGKPVMAVFAVTHYLPEFFPDPYTFNVERSNYTENQRLGAYRPYALGAHTCLGAGLAEIQVMATMAVLLRHVRPEAVPGIVKIVAAPGVHPDRHFSMKLAKIT